MKSTNKKTNIRIRRHARVRARVSGSAKAPRLAVFKSNKYIYAQLINDDLGKTLASASDMGLKGKTKTLRAKEAGKLLGKLAHKKKITHVVFDRGGFQYAGRVKSLAEGAREEGLKF
ncbi:MAG: 50S ribosomal protein L18 [Patescibacteria group bacterium]